VELWFLGQEYHDHLEKDVTVVSDEEKPQWQLDFQLCVVLWQLVEQGVLEIVSNMFFLLEKDTRYFC